MKKSNILLATSTVALLATGCVKPAQDNQAIYSESAQPTYTDGTQQAGVYQPTSTSTVYQPSLAGVVYEEPQVDTTVITTGTAVQQPIGGVTTYPDTYGSTSAATTTYPDTYGSTSAATTTYPDTYGTTTTTPTTTYPDPYANGGGSTAVSNSTYSSQAVTNYPATTSSSVGHTGGIQLQIAALKDYYTAKEYKDRLSLAPGLSAYVQRGAMNKVIVTGIPSMAEANRLKESRFPGAFIVHGGTSGGGYTPPVQPNYSTTSSGAYSVNNPYGTASSSSYSSTGGNSGIGVQIGAYGSRGKAQSVADSQSARYPATVKKIGRLYKVILTGFSSRSAAKSYAGRVGGFIVSTY